MENEKTPEEKLVEKLVGDDFFNDSNELDNDSAAKNKLYYIVNKVWKNGASVDEIQKVYDENLIRLKTHGVEDFNKRTKSYSKDNNKFSKVLIALVACCTLGGFLLMGSGMFLFSGIGSDVGEDFETPQEVTVGGISFNIPSEFDLTLTNETEDHVSNEYQCSKPSPSIDDYSWYDYNLIIDVYKTKSVEEVVSNISASEEGVVENKTYGKYSGYLIDLQEGLDYFIFEKDGKTIAICSASFIMDIMFEYL